MKIACCILATILLFPQSLPAKTSIITMTKCGKVVYVLSISDVSGSNWVKFNSWKAIKESDEEYGYYLLMLEDKDITIKKVRIEEDLGMVCV